MGIINWISVVIVVIVLTISLRRIFVKLQLDKVQKETQSDQAFQRKLSVVKQTEQARHVTVLIYLSILLASGLLLTTYSLFKIEDQVNLLAEKNSQLKDELQMIKTDQKKIINKFPVKAYPESGIGLKEYPWDDLFTAETNENQIKLEVDLSAKINPYFGLTTTLIMLDMPSQTLTIALAGDSGSEDNLQQIKDNVHSFVKEAEAVSKLTQVSFQMSLNNANNEKKMYSCTFSRENGESEFKLTYEE